MGTTINPFDDLVLLIGGTIRASPIPRNSVAAVGQVESVLEFRRFFCYGGDAKVALDDDARAFDYKITVPCAQL